MGLMTEAAITVWNGAQEGTVYHEAFHRVSLLLLSSKERSLVYKAARDKYSELAGKDDKFVEEFLAEKFREYKLFRGDSIQGSKLRTFMRKMYNFIRGLAGFKNRDLDRLYKDIDLGLYKNAKVNKDSLARFNETYKDGAQYGFNDIGLEHIKTYSQLKSVVGALTFGLFSIGNVVSIDNVSNLDLESLKESVRLTAESEQDSAKKLVFQEIYEKFDKVFKPRILKTVGLMGIDPENVTSNEVESHIKAAHEISKKDNIRTSVKMFISTMGETMFSGSNVVSVDDPTTGWQKFIPFDKSWNKMIGDLSNESSVSSMMEKIKRLSSNSAFYNDITASQKEAFTE
jgi:hypothetical protein